MRIATSTGQLGEPITGILPVNSSGQGGLLVRVDPEQGDKLIATTVARPVVMRGREMSGWLRVDDDDVRTKRQLTKWVNLGASYAGSLPAK